MSRCVRFVAGTLAAAADALVQSGIDRRSSKRRAQSRPADHAIWRNMKSSLLRGLEPLREHSRPPQAAGQRGIPPLLWHLMRY